MSTTRLLARRRVLPGFGLTFGFTVFYLSMIMLLPLSALCLRSVEAGSGIFVAALGDPRVVAAFSLSFGAALLAATVAVWKVALSRAGGGG